MTAGKKDKGATVRLLTGMYLLGYDAYVVFKTNGGMRYTKSSSNPVDCVYSKITPEVAGLLIGHRVCALRSEE